LVPASSLAREGQQERLRPRVNGPLGHEVSRERRARERQQRSDVHDPAAVALDHPGQRRPRDLHDRADVHGQQLVGGFGIEVDEAAVAAEAGVVDDQVHRRRGGARGDRIDSGSGREVGHHHVDMGLVLGSEALRQRFQPIAAAGDDNEITGRCRPAAGRTTDRCRRRRR
jgi:hypothetical protein